jgi:hypothetical protein
MRRNNHVALVILDPKDPYRYIQIRGMVTEITTQGAREHINQLSKKYTGREIYTGGPADEIRVTYRIIPLHVSV